MATIKRSRLLWKNLRKRLGRIRTQPQKIQERNWHKHRSGKSQKRDWVVWKKTCSFSQTQGHIVRHKGPYVGAARWPQGKMQVRKWGTGKLSKCLNLTQLRILMPARNRDWCGLQEPQVPRMMVLHFWTLTFLGLVITSARLQPEARLLQQDRAIPPGPGWDIWSWGRPAPSTSFCCWTIQGNASLGVAGFSRASVPCTPFLCSNKLATSTPISNTAFVFSFTSA